jgi:hypothetical protein
MLELDRVDDINMDKLSNYCTGLRSLWVDSCHITCTEIFDPELPHFRNLEELRLRRNWGAFDFCSILHMYVNVNVLIVVGMEQITDTFIRETVTAGGFRNVNEFVAFRCGYLSMETAWLLMQNFPI